MQTPISRPSIIRFARLVLFDALLSAAAALVIPKINPDAGEWEVVWTVTCTFTFIILLGRLNRTLDLYRRRVVHSKNLRHPEDRYIIQARLWRYSERCIVLLLYTLLGIVTLGMPNPARPTEQALVATMVFIVASFAKLVVSLVEEYLETLATAARWRHRKNLEARHEYRSANLRGSDQADPGQ